MDGIKAPQRAYSTIIYSYLKYLAEYYTFKIISPLKNFKQFLSMTAL